MQYYLLILQQNTPSSANRMASLPVLIRGRWTASGCKGCSLTSSTRTSGCSASTACRSVGWLGSWAWSPYIFYKEVLWSDKFTQTLHFVVAFTYHSAFCIPTLYSTLYSIRLRNLCTHTRLVLKFLNTGSPSVFKSSVFPG